MKRFGWVLVSLILIVLYSAAWAQGGITIDDAPDVIRPGKAIRIGFSASKPGNADLILQNASGKTVAVIAENIPAKAGRNHQGWDGYINGQAVTPGEYVLAVDFNGETATRPLAVGEQSPALQDVSLSSNRLSPGSSWSVRAKASMAGKLTVSMQLGTEKVVLYDKTVPVGMTDVSWDGYWEGEAVAPGTYTLSLILTDNTGFSSNEEQVILTIIDTASAANTKPVDSTKTEDALEAYSPIEPEKIQESDLSPGTDVPEVTPDPAVEDPNAFRLSDLALEADSAAKNSPSTFSAYTCDHTSCYWKLPMGDLDEAAIWDAMMQPMTVVKGEQRQVVKIYSEPSDQSAPVGEVTCDSQGLHVLESYENGWSLVEAYSSSIHSSKVKVWAEFVTGYIQTSRLEVKDPNKNFGLVLDKLTQRMYVFQNGKIITELFISTGLVNSKQPYNETPAGEFMIVSWTGGFWSGNMYCDMALRINGGILIHEVPCFIKEDVRYYETFERQLGKKASHGCVRVQQEKSSEGINMRWLWDNLKKNTRVFIWDDVGRNIPVPDAATPLYYNPDGGQYYHSDQNCSSVKSRYLPLKGFTYGELESEPYLKLSGCPACSPPKRQSEIETLNAGNNKAE